MALGWRWILSHDASARSYGVIVLTGQQLPFSLPLPAWLAVVFCDS